MINRGKIIQSIVQYKRPNLPNTNWKMQRNYLKIAKELRNKFVAIPLVLI